MIHERTETMPRLNSKFKECKIKPTWVVGGRGIQGSDVVPDPLKDLFQEVAVTGETLFAEIMMQRNNYQTSLFIVTLFDTMLKQQH